MERARERGRQQAKISVVGGWGAGGGEETAARVAEAFWPQH